MAIRREIESALRGETLVRKGLKHRCAVGVCPVNP